MMDTMSADYYGVDPRYGTLGDFVEFTHGCKQRGMRVLIDLVVNHTSKRASMVSSSTARSLIAISRLVCLVEEETQERKSGHRIPRRTTVNVGQR